MIVLDTHIFLWYVFDDAKLNAALRTRIASDPRDAYVSAVCIWEALLLAEKGRIELLAEDRADLLRSYIHESGLSELSLNREIAALSRTLPFNHEDPADRFIAATAFAMNAELATEDTRLRSLPWIRLAH